MATPVTERLLGQGDDWLDSFLFDRRVVVIRGPLDLGVATRVASQLMTLDATGDEPVQLQLDSSGGPLEAAFAVVDVIEAMGVPVEVVCMGRVESTAVAVAAVCHDRSALVHTRFRLGEPEVEVSGPASQLEAQLAHHRRGVDSFVEAIARAAGREAPEVAEDCRARRLMDAEEAVTYGLVDRVVSKRPQPARPPNGRSAPAIPRLHQPGRG